MNDTITNDTIFTVVDGRPEVDMSRTFAAPRALVFRALTTADSIAQWWGPARYETVVDALSATAGGAWRFINRDAESEHAFHGWFHAVDDEQIVYTFEYEGAPGHVALETVRLTDVPGGTNVRVHTVYQSVDDRDAVADAGMESGARESWDRLAALLAKD
jgi:uncharacterized protein YndB with AHSA1/START domain